MLSDLRAKKDVLDSFLQIARSSWRADTVSTGVLFWLACFIFNGRRLVVKNVSKWGQDLREHAFAGLSKRPKERYDFVQASPSLRIHS